MVEDIVIKPAFSYKKRIANILRHHGFHKQRLAGLAWKLNLITKYLFFKDCLMTAFLFTWKEKGWPYECIQEMLSRYDKDGFVEEPWRIKSHKKVEIGSVAYLLKQGSGTKGIFGKGEVLGEPYLADDGRMKVLIKFIRFTDPRGKMLIDHEKTLKILQKLINTQFSGLLIDDSIAMELNNYF